MIYKLLITKEAEKDIRFLKKNEPGSYNKIIKLLRELRNHPRTGTGKPKILKNTNSIYSRRITRKHRLIYSVDEDKVTVIVISALGHYDDK